MSKKNLNDTMFSMFGVNKEEENGEAAVVAAEEQPVAAQPEYTPAVPKPQNGTTYLAPNSAMEGKLQTEGDVEIAGNFNGDIIAKGKVILHCNMQGNVTASSLQLLGWSLTGNISSNGVVMLDRAASVVGNITAGELVCSGKVKGDLDITGAVVLKDNALISGNILADDIASEPGTRINGTISSRSDNFDLDAEFDFGGDF